MLVNARGSGAESFKFTTPNTNHTQSLERELKELSVTLQTLQSEKQQLAEDDQEMIKQRAKLEFDVKDLEESLVDDRNSKVH